MGEPLRKSTRASEELNRLLEQKGSVADGIRAGFHRTMLWRFRTGRRVPHVQIAAKLAELSRGRIPMAAWFEQPRLPKASKGRV